MGSRRATVVSGFLDAGVVWVAHHGSGLRTLWHSKGSTKVAIERLCAVYIYSVKTACEYMACDVWDPEGAE